MSAPIKANGFTNEVLDWKAWLDVVQVDQATPEQIAVLYRVNAQGPHLQTAIAQAGVSVRELGGTKFFDLDVVKRAILELGSVAREQRATPEPPLFQSVSDVLRANGLHLMIADSGHRLEDEEALVSAFLAQRVSEAIGALRDGGAGVLDSGESGLEGGRRQCERRLCH